MGHLSIKSEYLLLDVTFELLSAVLSRLGVLPLALMILSDTKNLNFDGISLNGLQSAPEKTNGLDVVGSSQTQILLLASSALGVESQINLAVVSFDLPLAQGVLSVKLENGVSNRVDVAVHPDGVLVLAHVALLQVEAEVLGVSGGPEPFGVSGQQTVGRVQEATAFSGRSNSRSLVL